VFHCHVKQSHHHDQLHGHSTLSTHKDGTVSNCEKDSELSTLKLTEVSVTHSQRMQQGMTVIKSICLSVCIMSGNDTVGQRYRDWADDIVD